MAATLVAVAMRLGAALETGTVAGEDLSDPDWHHDSMAGPDPAIQMLVALPECVALDGCLRAAMTREEV
jgi:hypothetical protein